MHPIMHMLWLVPGVGPQAYKGDFDMYGAKLTTSSMGGVICETMSPCQIFSVANIPVIPPWLLSMIQQCREFPQPNSLILKQSLEEENKNLFHPLVFPESDIHPDRPGSRPLGQADDMSIIIWFRGPVDS